MENFESHMFSWYWRVCQFEIIVRKEVLILGIDLGLSFPSTPRLSAKISAADLHVPYFSDHLTSMILTVNLEIYP